MEEMTIAEIAAGSEDFDILAAALDLAALTGAVADPTADFTVFAPTDAAFAALAADLGFTGDPADEDGVLDFIAGALAGLDPDGDPLPLLTQILTYHVSPGAQTSAEIAAAAEIATLEGTAVAPNGAILVDQEPDLADPAIAIGDIAASNGVIQAIDRVLLPLDIPGNDAPTLAEIAVTASSGAEDTDQDFDILLQALAATGLDAAAADHAADLTVFAPTDAAFLALAQEIGFAGGTEDEAFAFIAEALDGLSGGDGVGVLGEILTAHIAAPGLQAAEILAAQPVETLQGFELSVAGDLSLPDAEPDAEDARLTATDLIASNGVLHVLDGVIRPFDLPDSNGEGGVRIALGGEEAEAIRTLRDNDILIAQDGDDLLRGFDGDDQLFGGAGDDAAFGGRGDDRIEGGAGDDGLVGFRGADILIGGAGDDRLFGGLGDDVIEGGAGRDRLFGDPGVDRFVFREGFGEDRVLDFNAAVETLDFSAHAGVDDLADLTVAETAGSAVILDDAGGRLVLVGIGVEEIDADNFAF